MLPDPELLRFHHRLNHHRNLCHRLLLHCRYRPFEYRTRRYLLVAKNLRDVRQRLSGTENNMSSRNQRT